LDAENIKMLPQLPTVLAPSCLNILQILPLEAFYDCGDIHQSS
jgi:hypothetical protein